MLCKDAYSHYRHIYFLKSKSDASDRLIDYFKLSKTQCNVKVECLRTDNGGEFVNQRVNNLINDWGIRHQKTIAYTPEQNGCVEREMRTNMEAVGSMLDCSSLDKRFWAEAAKSAVYVLNLTGSSSVTEKTPYELWEKKPLCIEHLHAFGCSVFVHVPKEKRKKLDMKATKCVFVGYGINKKGYRCWNPETNLITTVRDVKFVEEEAAVLNLNRKEGQMVDRSVVGGSICDVDVANIIPHRLRSDLKNANAMLCVDDPLSYEEAMNSDERDKWRSAMAD